MGHVPDFNGVNTCDEADLPQTTSDLISTDSLLELPLNENFMPIYHSFPDDIYRQPHLYASNNLTSFMNNEDDRSGYFDEPLELDLFLDSNFNIDFDPTEAVLENDSHAMQNNTDIEANNNERNISTPLMEDVPECTSNQEDMNNDSENQSGKSHVEDNFSLSSNNDGENYSAAAVCKGSEVAELENEQIPKIIIKLKPESQNINKNFTNIEHSLSNGTSDLTNNKSSKLKTHKNKVKDKHKHKKHKKKSRHKKKHDLDNIKNIIPAANSCFNDSVANCTDDSYINVNSFLNNKSSGVNNHMSDIKTFVYSDNNSVDNSDKNISFVNTKLETEQNNYGFHDIETGRLDSETDEKVAESLIESDSPDLQSEPLCDEISQNELDESLSITNAIDIKTEPLCDEIQQNELNESFSITDSIHIKTESHYGEIQQNGFNESLSIVDEVDFQFKFENTDEFSLSSPISIKKENDSSLDNFCDEIDDSSNRNIPGTSVLTTERDESSIEASDHEGYKKQELHSDNRKKSTVLNNEPTKSSSASDLIEELNAHHQQVFEEIEISTSELKLELSDAENTDIRPKTSHQSHNSANDHIILQNTNILKHGENDMNSQNQISVSKTSSAIHHAAAPQSASNHYSSTARLRNISSSSSSINSKSSTSHRSYRKRRRSSSSSSSSDQEKFYNRPVKFDPVTQTYCDEFGREIRPSELKYYLNSKSSLRDSHSNNGSSSSSRSKSPRYKTHHRKYHKSRSGSRSHRRRRHSSSRSRSRSQGRRHKSNYDRKYRSPSPKHRTKRHYLDVEENMRAYEERRVMYVGDIPPDYTVEQLKDRFSRFGPIQSASIKSKFTADGSLYIFGFVTFKNRSDVCQAIERGNENPSWPRFDLNFGGRRRFCNGNYTDLDGKVAEAESGWYQTSYRQQPRQEDDFAELLRQEQRRLGMSKK